MGSWWALGSPSGPSGPLAIPCSSFCTLAPPLELALIPRSLSMSLHLSNHCHTLHDWEPLHHFTHHRNTPTEKPKSASAFSDSQHPRQHPRHSFRIISSPRHTRSSLSRISPASCCRLCDRCSTPLDLNITPAIERTRVARPFQRT